MRSEGSVAGKTAGRGRPAMVAASLLILAVATAHALPTITTQPTNRTVTAPAAATFTVAATGSPTPTYQWRKGTVASSTVIAGATSASYTTPATSASDNGSTYFCAVSSNGTVNTNVVTLTVNYLPVINTPPQPAFVNVGQTATFTVSAAGNPAPTYQWQKNQVNISGATSASYTTPATTAADQGALYRVRVTNSVGTTTSLEVELNVRASFTNITYGANVAGVVAANKMVVTMGASNSGELSGFEVNTSTGASHSGRAAGIKATLNNGTGQSGFAYGVDVTATSGTNSGFVTGVNITATNPQGSTGVLTGLNVDVTGSSTGQTYAALFRGGKVKMDTSVLIDSVFVPGPSAVTTVSKVTSVPGKVKAEYRHIVSGVHTEVRTLDVDPLAGFKYASNVDGQTSETTINASGLTTTAMVITPKWKVQQVPDYVFEPGYALPSLDSVERFVSENRHLPGIPKAEEIVEKGVDIGTLNMELLKHIEHLHLYIIKQDKALRDQEKRISVQAKRLDRLEKSQEE